MKEQHCEDFLLLTVLNVIFSDSRLNNQLRERNSEIPFKPSTDTVTCQSQLDKLTSLYSYIDTFPDRVTPLENTTTTLKNLKYTAIQSVRKQITQ